MSIVVDASISLAWCFVDEATPESNAILDLVGDTGAIVPPVWHLEVANTLVQAERRGRISAEQIETKLSLLAQLAIEAEPPSLGRAWSEIMLLARQHGLTTYDASYLELATRRKVPIATLDRALAAAARACNVKLL